MGGDGNCKICPGHCHWTSHFNRDYVWETYETEEEQTIEELKAKFNLAADKKATKEQLLKGYQDETLKLCQEFQTTVEELQGVLENLKELALQPGNPLTSVRYIETLIKGARYKIRYLGGCTVSNIFPFARPSQLSKTSKTRSRSR
jgi:hypothetical protein